MKMHDPPSELKFLTKVHPNKTPVTPLSSSLPASGQSADRGSISDIVAGVMLGLGYTPGSASSNPAHPHASTLTTHAPTHSAQQSDPRASSPIGMLTEMQIESYLEFLYFSIKQQHEIAKILRDNDLADYRLLNGEDAPRPILERLGLTTGMISRLYRGVGKFAAAIKLGEVKA